MAKQNYSKHVHKGYNRRGNMKLGFETDEAYDDFCRHLVEVYEDNERMTIRSLCKWAEQEYDVTLYHTKAHNILKKYNADIRDPSGARSKRRTRMLRFTVEVDDYMYVQDVGQRFEGTHMKREFSKFCLHLVRGTASNHLILWLSEFKPIVFLYDPKLLSYTIIGEDISKLEEDILGELLAQVDEVNNLEPVKAFAREKGLMYWGDNR